MLSRRRALQGGLAAAGALSVDGPLGALAQTNTPSAVRYNEVVRSILYTPAYAAIAKGFFQDVGIEVALETGQGGDKSMAALISGRAGIGLMGPESAIYVKNSESPLKVKIFCGLTATDGYVLVGREKVDNFDWKMLKGKEVLGRSTGTTPLVYLEWAMRQNGIDPQRDVKFNNNVAVPARQGAWLAGQSDYAIFIEPEASQLELDGKAHFLASVGKTVGMVDYTVFMATDKYIQQNPGVLQNWTNAIFKAQKWTASAPTTEIVKVQQQFFPGLSAQVLTAATERYRNLKIWKETPLIEEKAIETFQDMLMQGGLLEASKRVKYHDIIVTEFANRAMTQ
jgi:NitT/TauT family transport system substrate-binding protein